MKLKGMLLAATAVLVAGLHPGQAAAEKITLKIASGHSPSWHFIQLTQNYFMPEVKKRVKEKTGDDIEFIEGFSGSVAKTNEVLESVKSGVVDVGIYCICHEPQRLALNNFPMYLPFGPSDPEVSVNATRKVYDANPELAKQFGTHGQRLLSLVPFEPYNIVARTPINKASEIKGRKIGAAGPNAFWVENAGALPVSVPGPDMYTSLQTGMIDSMVIFLSVMDSLKLFEVAPNFVDASFGAMTVTSLTINERRFGRLPKDVQNIIVEVGREMENKSGPFTREISDKTLAAIKSRGINVVTVPEPERQAWAEMLVAGTTGHAKKFETDNKVPMRKVMLSYIAATEAAGYKWPVKAKLD